MNKGKKVSLKLTKIKLWGPKICMVPEIKLTGDDAVKDALRDRLQQRPKSARG